MPDVSAVIPTRGNVDMWPVIESLPLSWEVVIWNNGHHCCHILQPAHDEFPRSRHKGLIETKKENYMGYGRHAGAALARGEIIYTQDDDVIVSNPGAIVEHWQRLNENELFMSTDPTPWPGIVANLPVEFRPHYTDSAMLGFGAAYHRTTPAKVFSRFLAAAEMDEMDELFLRESDRALTALTPFSLVVVDKEDREFASDPDRLWKQSDHIQRRDEMLALARRVRSMKAEVRERDDA